MLMKPTALRAAAAEHGRGALTRLSKTAWLLANPRTSLALLVLFASEKMRPLLRIEPRLMFKFLPDYLAAGLSRRERAGLLIHHYTFLNTRVDGSFFAQISDRRMELWQLAADDHVHRIWLLFPGTPYSEGDLTLIFEADGVDIYTLSFTIGPGSIAGLDARDVMYIPRVQGKGHGMDQIRAATRSCGDVSPAALLLAAADGIAQALELDHMVGIGASIQVTTSLGKKPDELMKAYDEFWTAMGGSRLDRNMYELPVSSTGKSILLIKRDHRSRTLRKRRFKKMVSEQVCQTFRDVAQRRARQAPAVPANPVG